jgi:serine protease Do
MSNFRSAIRLVFASGVLLFLMLGGAVTAHGQPNQSPESKAAAFIKPAVVYLESNFKGWVVDTDGKALNNGNPFGITVRCTGFSVTPDGYIGTAGHCVDPDFQRAAIVRFAAEGLAGQGGKTVDQWVDFGTANWLVEGQQKGTLPDREFLVSGAGQRDKGVKPLPARVLDFRPLGEGDVALLKVELNGKTVPAAELAPNAEPQVGDPILAVGYPASTDNVTDFTLDPVVKSGTISARETWKTQPLFQVSAPMSKGMSGGPTVDLQGRVIGLNSFSPVGEQQAFNFISPVQGLKELIARNGVQPKLSPADAAFRNGINSYFSGNYGDAINNFDNALAIAPQYPGAFDMRTSAVKLRAETGGTGSSSGGMKPWMWLAGGVVVAALIGGGVLVYALSRRDKEPALPDGGSYSPAGVSSPAPTAASSGARASSGGGYAASPAPSGPPPPPSPSGESHCINCGFGLAPGAQFCPRCGKPQR